MSLLLYATLGANDHDAARRFYDAALAPLGLRALHADADYLGYGVEGEPIQLWICKPYDGQAARPANGGMLALRALTRAQVDAVHAAALAAGGQDEGAPGLRDYGPDFYAAYFRDLDGNKLAVVCKAPA